MRLASPSPRPRSGLATAAALVALAIGLPCPGDVRATETVIADVRVSDAAFNPSAGQTVTLSYRLAADRRVSVRVFDPDDGRVRTLVDAEERAAGEHSEEWDGRDVDGQVVPDEAYFFVIETSAAEVWDPKTFSGGEVGHVDKVEVDRVGGTINYRLPAAARVLCRLGIDNGPMHKTLVDWKPRLAGAVTEYWQGWDEDGVVRFTDHPRFSGFISYVELPDASVIAFGNRDTTYREVKRGRGRDRPLRPERPREARAGERLRPTGLVPPAWSRAPRVKLTFVDLPGEAEVPEVGERVRVRVEVDATDREQLETDPYEIMFYVDDVFFAEAERGYSPLNWIWETHQLPPGEHVLTVNLSSMRGQVGVASRRVRVRPRE